MAYEPRIESNNLDLTSILSTINELPEAGGGASLDVVTALILPAAVVDGRAIIITPTTPGKIIFSYAAPSDPVSGDIWVHIVDNGGYTLSADGAVGIRITPGAVMQFNGSIWEYRNAYIGVSGEWKLFSTLSPLSSLTWAQIIAIGNSGEDASLFFAIGDEKDLALTTDELVPVVIGDFKHNTITGTSNKAAMAFTSKNCLSDKRWAVDSSGANSVGWSGSQMRISRMVTLLNALPSELIADGAIKHVDVKTSAGNQSTTITTSSDRLRLHSVVELGLSPATAAPGEGTTYAYYASGNRVKMMGDEVAASYWTRSPAINSTANFCYINSVGAAGAAVASGVRSIAFAFDI